jgi:hypothetical protein
MRIARTAFQKLAYGLMLSHDVALNAVIPAS